MGRRNAKPTDSERAAAVRRWFGLDGPSAHERAATCDGVIARICPVRPGGVVLIAGPSGAGKSTLLRGIRRRVGAQQGVDLAAMRPGRRRPVDLFGQMSLVSALRLLARAGLADARAWLTPAHRLSAGQRWRLRLAMALACAEQRRPGPVVLFGDDFAIGLDGVTASVICRSLRRLVDARPGLAAVVATVHEELAVALAPDLVVRCDFGAVSTEEHPAL